MTEREAIRRLNANEDQAIRSLLLLIQSARAELVRRLADLPAGYSEGETIIAMRVALDRALLRVAGGMTETLATGMAESLVLGTALADAAIPAGILATFSINPFVLAQLSRTSADLVTGLTIETRARVTRAVQLGFLTGESSRDVARRVVAEGIENVRPFPSVASRAEAIARTEMGRIANTATRERGREAAARIPDLQKRWLATRDLRTRPSHAAANGQTVGIDEDFNVGGYPAAHPHDPRLPAGESARCRCRVTLHVPEEDEG